MFKSKLESSPQNVENSAALFLSADELFYLTGYKQKNKQNMWLQKSGIPFDVNRIGTPIVLRDSVRQAFSVNTPKKMKSKSIDLKSLSGVGAR